MLAVQEHHQSNITLHRWKEIKALDHLLIKCVITIAH